MGNYLVRLWGWQHQDFDPGSWRRGGVRQAVKLFCLPAWDQIPAPANILICLSLFYPRPSAPPLSGLDQKLFSFVFNLFPWLWSTDVIHNRTICERVNVITHQHLNVAIFGHVAYGQSEVHRWVKGHTRGLTLDGWCNNHAFFLRLLKSKAFLLAFKQMVEKKLCLKICAYFGSVPSV